MGIQASSGPISVTAGSFTVSSTGSFTVVIATTTTVTASVSPATVNQPVTFTAIIASTVPGSPITSGTVAFYIDGSATAFDAAEPVQNGSARSASISTLALGTHQIVAVYSPTQANITGSDNRQAPYTLPVENPPAPPQHVVITGQDAGGESQVKVFDATTGALQTTILPYGAFGAGVRVAVGDLQGNGTPEIITVPGPGGGCFVAVFSTSGQMLFEFSALANGSNLFTGGAYVAAADIYGQGYDDIIVSADAGGGPAVAIFDGKTGQQVGFFFAFPTSPSGAVFTGGVRVAAGTYQQGGPAVIFTAAGPGGGPAVSVWSAADIAANQLEKTFYVLPPDAHGNFFTGGVYLGAVYVSSLGRDYLVSGAAPGGGPAVSIIDPLNTATGIGLFVGQPFYALDPSFFGGVRVAGGTDVLITGPGSGGGPVAESFNLSGPPPLVTYNAADPSNPNFFGGLFVAAM